MRGKRIPYVNIALYALALYVTLTHLGGIGGFFAWLLTMCACVTRGLCLAFAADIPIRFLERTLLRQTNKSKRPRKLTRYVSIALTYALGAAAVSLITSMVLPSLLDAMSLLIRSLEDSAPELLARAEAFLLRVGVAQAQIDALLADGLKLIEDTVAWIGTQSSHIAIFALDVTGAVLGGTVEAVLTVVVAAYALLEKEKLLGYIRVAAQTLLKDSWYRELSDISARLIGAFRGFIRGQCAGSAILGLCCFAGMKLFGMPYAAMISTLVGVLSLVPLLGPWLGALLGAGLILTVNPATALGFLLYLFALNQLEDSFVYPRLVGEAMGIPPLITLSAILIGGRLYGVVGMFVAVPLASALCQRAKRRVQIVEERKKPVAAAKPDAAKGDTMLCVTIPAYNEEANIESVVAAWHDVVSRFGGDGSKLLVLDDGSKDGTKKVLKRLCGQYPLLECKTQKNRGHGPTVRALYEWALRLGADYVFQTDSDGQTDPAEFEAFWAAREEADLVIGRRATREDGLSRIIVTRVLRLTLLLSFGLYVKDANTPFRLMRAESLRRLLPHVPEDAPLSNVLLSVLYQKAGLRVLSKEITFKPRQGGKNSINLPRILRIGAKALSDFARARRSWRDGV